MTRRTKVTLIFMMLSILLSVFAFAADDPFIGDWKLNSAKSKQINVPKAQINKFEPMPNGVTFILDGEDQKGNKFHQEYTAYNDGKFYPVKGDPDSDTVSRKLTDSHHVFLIRKKGDKIVSYRSSSVAKDGKTYTTRLTDAAGKPIDAYFQVFDKQ